MFANVTAEDVSNFFMSPALWTAIISVVGTILMTWAHVKKINLGPISWVLNGMGIKAIDLSDTNALRDFIKAEMALIFGKVTDPPAPAPGPLPGPLPAPFPIPDDHPAFDLIAEVLKSVKDPVAAQKIIAGLVSRFFVLPQPITTLTVTKTN